MSHSPIREVEGVVDGAYTLYQHRQLHMVALSLKIGGQESAIALSCPGLEGCWPSLPQAPPGPLHRIPFFSILFSKFLDITLLRVVSEVQSHTRSHLQVVSESLETAFCYFYGQ